MMGGRRPPPARSPPAGASTPLPHLSSPPPPSFPFSQAALINLAKGLAQDLAPAGIRVNVVAPGPVWTPLVAASFGTGKLATFGKADSPLGRVAQPAELAGAFVFLADAKASSYVSGAVLAVTGGRML